MQSRSAFARVLGGFAVASLLAVSCSSDDGPEEVEGVDGTDFTEILDAPATTLDDGFDPEVVDEGLVASTVTEVLLDDDVIIATDDGELPTTTTEPPPSPLETIAQTEASTTTAAPAPLPEPSSIRRVVSLTQTHTQTIASLGLAGLLVGVDAESTIPDGASGVVRDFLVADDLDLDDLQGLDVDLVVIGDFGREIALEELTSVGIPVFDGSAPRSRAGVEQQILDLAAALDRPETGVELVASMRSEVDAILASLPPSSGLTYFHEIDPGFATFTPGTLVDSLYGELGLMSIIPPQDGDVAFFPGSDLIAADPDVVVLADIDCCAATAAGAAARSGWGDMSAVRNGAIVEVPDDIASRWGTNIVELMRLVAGAVVAAS